MRAAGRYYTDRYLAERFPGRRATDELGHLMLPPTRSPEPAAPEDRLVLLSVADRSSMVGWAHWGDRRRPRTQTSTFTDQLSSRDAIGLADRLRSFCGEAIRALLRRPDTR